MAGIEEQEAGEDEPPKKRQGKARLAAQAAQATASVELSRRA